MKNLNNILSKIEKVELAEVNVELSLADDAKELADKYYRLTDNIDANFAGVLQGVNKLITQISEAEKLSNDMPKLISKYEQVAKEIGIDVNNIADLQSLKRAVKDVDQYKDLANKLKSL